MGAIKRALDKYRHITNNKLVDYKGNHFYFIDTSGSEIKLSRRELVKLARKLERGEHLENIEETNDCKSSRHEI